jgi:chitin disaccharide deacetylase
MAVGSRFLIVNADDFGRSPEVNSGVVEGYERGIVTSASLMVRWPAAAEAAAYRRDVSRFSLGLHVDLAEWDFREGEWVPVYEVVPMDDFLAVEAEVRKQLASFRELVEDDPTHLDSHQHVHTSDPAATQAVGKIASELSVPVRSASRHVRYCGDFYGQTATGEPLHDAITVESLIQILVELPPGVTELGCHPGKGCHVDTTYRAERERELEVLCDPRVREAMRREGIVLRSFAELGSEIAGQSS